MDALLLSVVVVLAAGTRAGYLIAGADRAESAGTLTVQTVSPELEALVNNLKDQNRFACRAPFAAEEEETAHVAPGYPWLVATVTRLVDPSTRDRTMRWLQCVLGTLTAGLYFLFARRAFQSRAVAFLTGLLCAVHPFWVLDTPTLADGVTTTFLLALALLLGARASQTSGPLSSLLFGLALAALAMMRAALLPFGFAALAWFLVRSRSLTRGWLCALLAFLGFVNGLAPWTFRNWQLYAEPMPIVDSAYYHLWIGNNARATGGPVSEEMLHTAPVEELAGIARQSDRYARLGGLVQQEVHDHPAETVRRRLQAGLDFLFGAHWFSDGHLAEHTGSAEAAPDWLAWSYPGVLESTLLGMIVLALLGWRWSFGRRLAAMPASLAAFWVPLPYVLSHADALAGPRLPLDGVLLCYAAFALVCLLPGRERLWTDDAENAIH
jgi:hypothetical protein